MSFNRKVFIGKINIRNTKEMIEMKKLMGVVVVVFLLFVPINIEVVRGNENYKLLKEDIDHTPIVHRHYNLSELRYKCWNSVYRTWFYGIARSSGGLLKGYAAYKGLRTPDLGTWYIPQDPYLAAYTGPTGDLNRYNRHNGGGALNKDNKERKAY